MFAPSYFAPGYFPRAYWPGVATPPRFTIALVRPRDRSVLAAIAGVLRATGEFDEVLTSGLPERRGAGGGDLRLASLELVSFREREMSNDPDGWPRERHGRYHCYLLVRLEDPDERDDEVDRLANVASNAASGQGFGGVCVPEFTMLDAGQYLPAGAPERRLVMAGTFCYLIDSYDRRLTT